jgi:hypothetical protein
MEFQVNLYVFWILQVESKHVEYLLYGETFQGSGELQLIVEEGFPFQSSESKSDAHVPVLLSNSIGLADICRLQVIKIDGHYNSLLHHTANKLIYTSFQKQYPTK